MLTDIHYQEIIKQQLVKIQQQREIIEGVYNALNDLAEQDGFLNALMERGTGSSVYNNHIKDMAFTAAKERTAIDKYLRGELYAY